MSKIVFIVFFIGFFQTPIGVDSLTQHFTLCPPNMALSEYVVPLPRPCRRHQQEIIHTCKAKFLSPSDALIKILFLFARLIQPHGVQFSGFSAARLTTPLLRRSTPSPTSLPFRVTNISSNRDWSLDRACNQHADN